jgi:NAD(P)-dependent dehydrogenase (short-subunit alcohol dehydrogenase family)
MSQYRNSLDLSGKVAVVTGGSGILGTEFCKGLADCGADVAVLDINEDGAKQLSEELVKEYKVRSLGIYCDVASPESVKDAVSTIVQEFGEINILHNNAGGKSPDLKKYFAPFEEYDLDEWRLSMSINIDGMFLMAQAVGKQMVKQGKGGSIIQTSSIYGVAAPDQRIYEGAEYLGVAINTPAVYAASKGAVIGLTNYLSTYWATKGIRVNTLTPGGVASGQNEEFTKKYSNRVPLGRMAERSEMVGALLYLASEASSYVTGQNIIVDGGLTTW